MPKRKLSRREFLKGAALGGAGLAIAACTAVPAPAPAPAAAPAEVKETPVEAPPAEVTIVRFMTRAGADNTPTYVEVLNTDFRQEHPDIEVQVEPAPDGWVDKLLAQMVAGTAVDIFEAWGNIFFNWTERGLILDVQPFVDAQMPAEEINDFNDFQWKGLEILGVRAGLPKYINLMTVTINKDIFDKYGIEYPPEDGEWDHNDYAELAARLTKAARDEGNENFWGGWYPAWNWDRFWYRVDMFGGSAVNEKYGTVCMLDTPESQEGLQWSWDRMWTDNSFAQPSQVENKWGSQVMAPGFVGFMEDGTYPQNTDRALREAFRWDMRHVPKGPTGIRKVLGTTDAWSITKQSKVPDQAWEVLRFAAGPIFQSKAVVGQEGLIPVRKSLISTFIDDVRRIRPTLEEVRLETISEILDWGYAEDSFWFKNQNAASEILVPALEKVYIVGDVGPEYFIEVCKQVNESQNA
jgi:multiple sugar transport system substrate-binding protein